MYGSGCSGEKNSPKPNAKPEAPFVVFFAVPDVTE